ncbi:MAG: hypothetical protein ACFFCQ_13010 [Promethearchaeota archaeon]
MKDAAKSDEFLEKIRRRGKGALKNRSLMKKLYIDLNMTGKEIAKIIGCHKTTVHTALRKFQLKKISMKDQLLADPTFVPELIHLSQDPRLKIKKICQILSSKFDKKITRHMYRHLMADLKLERINRSKRFEHPLMQQYIIAAYLQGQSIHTISEKYGMHTFSIQKVLEKNGVVILSGSGARIVTMHLEKDYWIPISDMLSEIIDGQLLEDGALAVNTDKGYFMNPLSEYINSRDMLRRLRQSNLIVNLPNSVLVESGNMSLDLPTIIPRYNNARDILSKALTAKFTLHMSCKAEEWVLIVANCFSLQNYPTNVFLGSEEDIYLRSKYTVQLYKQYLRWYPEGKKRIPKDLTLTPLVVFHWYMGDGGADIGRVKLATCCFPEEDVDFLIKIMKEELGISSFKVFAGFSVDGEKEFHIYIKRKNDIKLFFDYMNQISEEILSIGKQVYPWRFSTKIRKKDCVLH